MGDRLFRFLRGESLPHNDRWDRFWKIAGRIAIAATLVQAGIALPQTVSSMEGSLPVIEAEDQTEDHGEGESDDVEGQEGKSEED